MVWLIIIACLIWLTILWYFIVKRGYSNRVSNGNWQQLLRICLGNEKQAQRLLEHEKRLNPQLTDDEACRMAIVSYKRDNR